MNVQGALVYPNLYWNTSERDVVDQALARASGPALPAVRLLGQFAVAVERDNGWWLVRDRLGINKLFYAVDRSGMSLNIGSSFYNLAAAEGDAAAIKAVPPGHALRIDARSAHAERFCYDDISRTTQIRADDFDPVAFRMRVRDSLDAVFREIRERFAGAQFVVCLSGGLDSAVIASWAVRHLPGAVAATFSYLGEGGTLSDDFRAAARISGALGLEHTPVLAERAISVDDVDEVLKMCQDWRDFNVHCAWVNALIAADLKKRWPSRAVVVLTGDLMNEYVADYSAVTYRGTEYYPQPRLSRERRRRVFVSGLDTSDREIGVFHHFGLTAIQPYSVLAEEYLSVPASFLDRPDCKPLLNLELIPDEDVRRFVTTTKVRAQVGGEDGGTLGLFHDAGITQTILRERWDALFAGFGRASSADPLIVAGRYRC
jgi:asparagine synthetase B (glutamine-hydrolysing)